MLDDPKDAAAAELAREDVAPARVELLPRDDDDDGDGAHKAEPESEASFKKRRERFAVTARGLVSVFDKLLIQGLMKKRALDAEEREVLEENWRDVMDEELPALLGEHESKGVLAMNHAAIILDRLDIHMFTEDDDAEAAKEPADAGRKDHVDSGGDGLGQVARDGASAAQPEAEPPATARLQG